MSPGNLDPVEVLESLPEELQSPEMFQIRTVTP